MADVKISALPASTTPLAGTEVLPIVQSSQTKQVSVANLTAGRAVSAISYTPTGSTIPTNGVYLPAANSVGVATDSTERMRVHATGGVSIGTTADSGSGGLRVLGTINGGNNANFATTGLNQQSGFVIQGGSATGISYNQISHSFGIASGALYSEFMYATGAIGSITQNGTTGVLYNIVSDQRLKENIADAPSSSNDIDAIQVRSFNFISDNSSTKYGFIAQELETVAPYAVYKPTDKEAMMGVDYSKLVPMMLKEIQSLRARLKAANIE